MATTPFLSLGTGLIVTAAGLAACGFAADPALAQDRSWSIAREATSPIDGQKTLIIGMKRGETAVTVGCTLAGPAVAVDLGSALLPPRPNMPGKYRIDLNPPVNVSWDASGSQTVALTGEPARVAMAGLLRGAIWHIRVNHFERSIEVEGLAAFRRQLREACGVTTDASGDG